MRSKKVSAAAVKVEVAVDEKAKPVRASKAVLAGKRLAHLEELAAASGKKWAVALIEQLRIEGRAAAGGWPGTMPEARARVADTVEAASSRHGLASTTAPERERAAERLYASARHLWLSERERER
jgi:hypothetical protein